MSGVMGVYCMRYGAWVASLLKDALMQRYNPTICRYVTEILFQALCLWNSKVILLASQTVLCHMGLYGQTHKQTCILITSIRHMLLFLGLQAIQKVDSGYRLSPPPGCPRAIYELMIQCWYLQLSVSLSVYCHISNQWYIRYLIILSAWEKASSIHAWVLVTTDSSLRCLTVYKSSCWQGD